MPAVPTQVLKRRAAVERWKANNRKSYLEQKRELAARASYRSRMRAKYAQQQGELREAGILPRKMGRRRLYEGEEALERKRERQREATARYHMKISSQAKEKDESTTTSETTSEDST